MGSEQLDPADYDVDVGCPESESVTIDGEVTVNGAVTVDGEVSVANWDDMPVGIEAALAAKACLVDTDGNPVGKTFVCKLVDEATGDITYSTLASMFGATTVDTYDPAVHGAETSCQSEPAAAVGSPTCMHVDGTPATVLPVYAANPDGTVTITWANPTSGTAVIGTVTAPNPITI